MKETLVFIVAMYSGLLIGSALSVWAFGYVEPALGGAKENFALSAALSALIATLGVIGFVLAWRKSSYAPMPVIALSGIVAAALVFAWPIIAQPISSDAVNLAGFGIYCVGLGLVSSLILSRLRFRRAA